MRNLPSLLQLVDKNDFLAISLQEVWLREYNASSKFTRYLETFRWLLKLPDGTLEVEDLLNHRNKSYQGVALGVSNEVTETMTEHKVQSMSVIAVSFIYQGRKLLVIAVYLPTRGKDKQFDEALESISNLLEGLRGEYSVLIFGDLNNDSDSVPKV